MRRCFATIGGSTRKIRMKYPMPRPALLSVVLGTCLIAGATSGCAVVEVAGATAGAAISIAGAVVSTGVRVTGKVAEKAIDVVTPDSK
jgi:hypothetical protein